METYEEHKWVSQNFKGEAWEDAKKSLLEHGFIEIEGQHFQSPKTGVVYRFVLRRDGDLFITRIETLENNIYSQVEYSVSDRVNRLQKISDRKKISSKIEKEMKEEFEFELSLGASVEYINSCFNSKRNQNSKYRKNKNSIEQVIDYFKNAGFDFSQNISIFDALMFEDDYCVLETRKRSSDKNLRFSFRLKNGQTVYLYKAKPDEVPACLHSGVLVKNLLGTEAFYSICRGDYED